MKYLAHADGTTTPVVGDFVIPDRGRAWVTDAGTDEDGWSWVEFTLESGETQICHYRDDSGMYTDREMRERCATGSGLTLIERPKFKTV